jgi:hypothetical protein
MPENNFSKAGYYCLIKYRNNLIAGSPNGLFISSDEANSWNKINDNIFLNILAFENYLIAGTIDGCYISFDSGETWVESNEGIQKRIFSGIYNNKKDVFGTALGDKIHSNKIGDLGKIKISNINKTEFCSKDDLTISYKTAPGVTFNPNNEFIFELFDVNNYNKFTTIYKIKSIDLEHSYTFQIPDSIKFNTNYRIRVRSTSPEFLSIDNLDNITIVQKNLNKIAGANVVCQDSTEIYKIATQDGYTYKWSAKGGTITSGDNLPEITVKWQTPGIGSIIVNKVSVLNCNSSDSVSITINPKPAKPIITLSDNMMNVSSTEKIKWYLNGSIINGESNDTLITNTVGNYKVSVTNSFGCVSYSDEVVYNPNAVYLLLSSHKASPGEEFTMDIKVSKTRSFKELKINEIKATLSFNATTLYPVSAEKGTVNSTDENRYITVTLDTNLDINQVIKQYRLLAMLGNKGMDTVRLINITPNNVFAKNGIFTLNVCLDENGKPRLISSIKTLQIVSVSPNPGYDLIKVDFYTESAEKLKITLANSFGETIKEIGSGEYNSGENSVESSIKDLPFGSYFVIIESLTGRDSFGIIKAK